MKVWKEKDGSAAFVCEPTEAKRLFTKAELSSGRISPERLLKVMAAHASSADFLFAEDDRSLCGVILIDVAEERDRVTSARKEWQAKGGEGPLLLKRKDAAAILGFPQAGKILKRLEDAGVLIARPLMGSKGYPVEEILALSLFENVTVIREERDPAAEGESKDCISLY